MPGKIRLISPATRIKYKYNYVRIDFNTEYGQVVSIKIFKSTAKRFNRSLGYSPSVSSHVLSRSIKAAKLSNYYLLINIKNINKKKTLLTYVSC